MVEEHYRFDLNKSEGVERTLEERILFLERRNLEKSTYLRNVLEKHTGNLYKKIHELEDYRISDDIQVLPGREDYEKDYEEFKKECQSLNTGIEKRLDRFCSRLDKFDNKFKDIYFSHLSLKKKVDEINDTVHRLSRLMINSRLEKINKRLLALESNFSEKEQE